MDGGLNAGGKIKPEGGEMRTFESIGAGKCLICGTNKKGKCFLAEKDGTSDGSISEAVPVHVDCLDGIHYSAQLGVLYMGVGKEEAQS